MHLQVLQIYVFYSHIRLEKINLGHYFIEGMHRRNLTFLAQTFTKGIEMHLVLLRRRLTTAGDLSLPVIALSESVAGGAKVMAVILPDWQPIQPRLGVQRALRLGKNMP